MLKIMEGSLVLCITAAVLAFGGTEPVSMAVVEVALFAAAMAAIFGLKKLTPRDDWPALWVPATLIAVVALQLVPLPLRMADWLRTSRQLGSAMTGMSQSNFSALSIAPYYTRTHLLVLVCCVIVFWFARTLARERESRTRLVAWLLILGSFEALYGLVQYLSGWQKIFSYVKKYNLEEATGTYINRNHYAGFLEMVIPFGLALVLYEHSRILRRNFAVSSWKRLLAGENLPRLALGLFALVLMIAALLSSRSRMGILATVSSFAILFARARMQRKSGAWLAVLLVICVAGLLLWIGAGSALGRFGSIGSEYVSSEDSRLSIWQGTARLLAGHPLLGSGLGTFPVAFTTVQSTFLGKFVNHAHNDYLELASDLGIPAALLFFSSIVLLLLRLGKKTSPLQAGFGGVIALGCIGGISAMLLHSLTDFNLYIPANAFTFSLLLGLGAGISAGVRANHGQEYAA